MKILIDSDVCIDFLTGRSPHFAYAQKLFWKAENKQLDVVVSPESFSNIFYVLRKFYTAEQITPKLTEMRLLVELEDLSGSVIDQALNAGWSDFENAIQHFYAIESSCEAIITRNFRDYKKAKIHVITPFEFLEQF